MCKRKVLMINDCVAVGVIFKCSFIPIRTNTTLQKTKQTTIFLPLYDSLITYPLYTFFFHLSKSIFLQYSSYVYIYLFVIISTHHKHTNLFCMYPSFITEQKTNKLLNINAKQNIWNLPFFDSNLSISSFCMYYCTMY